MGRLPSNTTETVTCVLIVYRPAGRLLKSVRFEHFILTPPEAIAPPEVYIGNRLQNQYTGVWSVSIGIHHEQCSCSVLNNENLPFESFIGYI